MVYALLWVGDRRWNEGTEILGMWNNDDAKEAHAAAEDLRARLKLDPWMSMPFVEMHRLEGKTQSTYLYGVTALVSRLEMHVFPPRDCTIDGKPFPGPDSEQAEAIRQAARGWTG